VKPRPVLLNGGARGGARGGASSIEGANGTPPDILGALGTVPADIRGAAGTFEGSKLGACLVCAGTAEGNTGANGILEAASEEDEEGVGIGIRGTPPLGVLSVRFVSRGVDTGVDTGVTIICGVGLSGV